MNNLSTTNLNLYKSFYFVARELSFTKASEKLFISQPALSYNVKCLENNLHTKLFIRTKEGIILTNNGITLYNSLSDIFKNLHEIENKISIDGNIEEGKLSIGATRNIADYYLSEIISEFVKKYRNIKINIRIGSTKELIELLEKNEINVIFDNLPIGQSKYRLTSCIVSEFKTCFVCNKEMYEKINKKVTKISDLINYDLILPGRSEKRILLDKITEEHNILLEPAIEMPNSNLMLKLIEKNNYIGFVIEKSIEEKLNKELFKLKIKEPLPDNKIVMLYIDEINKGNVANIFINYIANKEI